MKINFLTLFPNYFKPLIEESVINKAIQKGLINLNVVDFRDFSKSKHRKVDDEIFGGGHGLLLQIEPIDLALDSLPNRGGYKVLVTPQGKKFDQAIANELATKEQITFISGRYEGFDERIVELVDIELSIGDYVLTGGELPSMVMADSILRLVPGVIREESHKFDSFQNNGLLDYPQYTRPRVYKGMEVPEVLLNGNHKEIEKWKVDAQWQKTLKNRPDIIERIKNEK
ncbi:tRNA (guanosine(37)-N1)-methyltransferase TrmD [Mycoplasmopsis pullorum]|uniref:tRNA (guanine-N(1)-)-methyltransferase n=1 Tax=Mycoplasmopsis pullorum TaxID=48003 RepID=A0A1L4FRI5_9BACT|nr:tRNA (guanosine(37)-N1)-methyltransferase TrmD [Mycoplasmopsis pullorum]APJ38212.1 tRNA (guanosine(37)-N1)-methyltransferase TrmD [Mycoplasmopsis pullorum]TNK82667.1 tRNA (guanosine(37)-N1)-methyltransferase TrmD [Mycoplasmopsis pullorum]TNK83449.1 tRNA (guanosine(37)-N1)-methyltransferase TrmD [Mycoplasmopsis pullorum]TNK84003.1 tRNA (guanosine(37)-N1)-methyltransferase TrmD [Mycoplasmopsis pullorum]TNK85185.1 tRNA (guanosine(37)-N1)-methyltransferase TrmD [Mycoplasmopsis pullorum]